MTCHETLRKGPGVAVRYTDALSATLREADKEPIQIDSFLRRPNPAFGVKRTGIGEYRFIHVDEIGRLADWSLY